MSGGYGRLHAVTMHRPPVLFLLLLLLPGLLAHRVRRPGGGRKPGHGRPVVNNEACSGRKPRCNKSVL